MRTDRFAIACVALVTSMILISCGSDDDDAPADSGVPIVADSTIATLLIADTTIEISTDSTRDDSTDVTLDDDSNNSVVDDESPDSTVETDTIGP